MDRARSMPPACRSAPSTRSARRSRIRRRSRAAWSSTSSIPRRAPRRRWAARSTSPRRRPRSRGPRRCWASTRARCCAQHGYSGCRDRRLRRQRCRGSRAGCYGRLKQGAAMRLGSGDATARAGTRFLMRKGCLIGETAHLKSIVVALEGDQLAQNLGRKALARSTVFAEEAVHVAAQGRRVPHVAAMTLAIRAYRRRSAVGWTSGGRLATHFNVRGRGLSAGAALRRCMCSSSSTLVLDVVRRGANLSSIASST